MDRPRSSSLLEDTLRIRFEPRVRLIEPELDSRGGIIASGGRTIALSQKIMSLASQLVQRYQQAAAKSGSVSHIGYGPRNQQD